MSTPVSSLPLKTTQEQAPSIDDPLIQNVLKEFEDEYNSSMPAEQEQMPMHEQVSAPASYSQPPMYQQSDMNYSMNYEKKEMFRIDLAKKGAILTLLILVLQKTNVLDLILKYAPEYLHGHVSGNEYIIYGSIIFVSLYALLYSELL